MGRKRVKQYLTLLMAIGVIAIVAGGGGTFASFSAEVTNSNNTFATGSLILNNTHGTTSCTSAVNNQTSTTNQNSSGTDCATLFSTSPFTYGHGNVASASNGATSITVSSLTQTIYRGDSLTLTDATGSITVTAANTTPVSTSGSVAVSALSRAFSGGTLIDNSPTQLADVTLQNAGTLAASDIIVTPTACSSQYREGSGTLTSGQTAGSAVTQVPFTTVNGSTFAAGDPVVVSQGTSHSQTFVATGPLSGGNIPVQSGQNWNFSYTTAATVSGPEFNGTSSNDLCSKLLLSITEESSSGFPTTNFSSATSCVYGGTSAPANTNACDLAGGTALTSTTAHTLGSGLAAGATRYFELAVHLNSTGFDNTYQNTSGTGFSLTWHIDQ